MSPDTQSTLQATEAEIARLMPTALDIVAAIVDEPATSWDTYAGTLEVAEQNSPLLLLAMARAAAGMASIAELTSDQVRALAS